MSTQGIQIAGPRLPYHPALKERYGVDQGMWRALVEAIFPNAKTVEGVLLALAYCRARKLDPLRRPVHIVPIWDSEKNRQIESVWPGISELRTTAFRTGAYAGCEETIWGPEVERIFSEAGKTNQMVRYPEWAQITVHRMVGGQKMAFPGPRIFWLEAYATRRHDSEMPNSMWIARPRGQLEKCAEAAALRKAFPEEIGGEIAVEELRGTAESAHVELASSMPRPPRPEMPAPLAESDADSDTIENDAALDAEYAGIVGSEPAKEGRDWGAWFDQAKIELAAAASIEAVNQIMMRRRQDLDSAPVDITDFTRSAALARISELKKKP